MRGLLFENTQVKSWAGLSLRRHFWCYASVNLDVGILTECSMDVKEDKSCLTIKLYIL